MNVISNADSKQFRASTTCDISVNIEVKVKAYTDRNRLMNFVYSTADLYFGRCDVTIEELVKACPPDTSADMLLKDPKRTAEKYIVHKYQEIAEDNRDEIEKLKKKLAESGAY